MSKQIPLYGDSDFFQTWDLFLIGAIRMLTAHDPDGPYEPDEIMVNPDFRFQGRFVGVARYHDKERLPAPELLAPYVRPDFKESFVLMKRKIFDKINTEVNKNESDTN